MGTTSILLLPLLLMLHGSSLLPQLVTPTAAAAPPPVSSSSFLSTYLKTYNPSLSALLKGISGPYQQSAYASPYVIWSRTGFPVAMGDDPNPLPVVAAVQLPSPGVDRRPGGRVVAFGHEAIPGKCCTNNDGWDKLTINAVRWMANGKKTVRMASFGNWWADSALQGVKSALTDLKVTISTVGLDTFSSGGSSNVDIYWIDSYQEYTAAHVTALLKFVNQTGKGLLVGGHAWYWSYSHPNANIYTDLSVNKVLWPLGLALTTNAQYGFQPAPASPPETWPYYNSYVVTKFLVDAKSSSSRAVSGSSLYPPANAALNLLLSTLPSRSDSAASGLTAVWSMLQSARTTSGTGVGPDSPLDAMSGYPGQVLDVAIEVWAIRRGELTDLKASRSAALYPGAPPANAAKVSVNLTINGTYNLPPYHFWYAGWDSEVWRSTGLYAPPGQLIQVALKTPAAVAKGLKVQIGAHTDDLTGKASWARLPVAYSRFDLNASVTSAGSPLGGLVFILVPPGSKLGDVQVEISNVVRAPYFKLGSTKLSDWNNTIRKYPGPWAELDSGKFVIMVPSKAIQRVYDPVPVLNHWNLVLDSMAYLANIPTDRARAERFLVDADIGGGWMHSGYPIMAYDYPEVHQELLDLELLKAKGAWGPYHELGHNHQWAEAQFSGTTESYNNVWTAYAMNKTGVSASEHASVLSPEGRAAIRAEYFANGANWEKDWNVWVALDTYLQLRDGFGWDFFRKMNAAYQQKTYPLEDDEVQTWIQTSSRVAGVNLVPFYTKWGFPVSQKTKIILADLPAWTANPFLQP